MFIYFWRELGRKISSLSTFTLLTSYQIYTETFWCLLKGILLLVYKAFISSKDPFITMEERWSTNSQIISDVIKTQI